jgi:DNA polymerase-3 subunit delta'
VTASSPQSGGNVFDRILGQGPAIETLVRALRSGRIHHAYRFEGPSGVGKEGAAFALAQSLVCTTGGALGCGKCGACLRAVRLAEDDPAVPQHPDVVLLGRGLYPPAALGTATRETTGIGVEQIRKLVLARVGFPPHEGRALVFIVREAEDLTQQAANALLKTLEEPPQRTHFVLLTSRPNRLLDTIRSRTLPVRFGPLPQAVVAQILLDHGKSTEHAEAADGSAEAALALADEEGARARAEFVRGALEAAASPTLDGAVVFAQTRPNERGDLRQNLLALSQHLAHEARQSLGSDDRNASAAARRHALVAEALDALERNAQPALALEAMITRFRNV